MPAQRRRSRKRRNPGSRPRAVSSTRREQRAERSLATERSRPAAPRQLGTVGERPPSPFGLPVSEIAIFAGGVGLVVGLIESASVALIVGVIVCTLGVLEITAREHFSGFRSHSLLLAAFPAVAIEIVLVLAVGNPRQSSGRAMLVLAVAPVFGGCFWLLRKRFLTARQARLAQPPVAAGRS